MFLSGTNKRIFLDLCLPIFDKNKIPSPLFLLISDKNKIPSPKVFCTTDTEQEPCHSQHTLTQALVYVYEKLII